MRGLNAPARKRAVKQKIEESQCAVACFQETKCETFDIREIRAFFPMQFDTFAFAPSVGSSGGILVVWNSAVLSGVLVEIQSFAVVVRFTSKQNNEQWSLVSVYGPCQGEARDNFVAWLYNLNIPIDDNWLIIGDFNFMRSSENRNLPGGDVNDIFIFNEIIGHLGLLELPLKGRSYTWSNMHDSPLLEQLDWFFTSTNWISVYPFTEALPLARTASDHVPCVVVIKTSIPKCKIFRFENYWVHMEGFLECVQRSWSKPSNKSHSSAIITDKMKTLRQDLKRWQTSFPR